MFVFHPHHPRHYPHLHYNIMVLNMHLGNLNQQPDQNNPDKAATVPINITLTNKVFAIIMIIMIITILMILTTILDTDPGDIAGQLYRRE